MSARHIVLEYPLSAAQDRLWIMDQLARGTPVYHLTVAFRLEGVLDVAALMRAATAMMSRHEALRTCFPERNLAEVSFPALPMKTYDLSQLPEDIRNTEAARVIADCAGEPFDPVHGPMWRIRLLRLAESVHSFALTMHHLVSDGASLAIFLRELSVVYNAYRIGSAMPLSEIPIPYSSFVLSGARQIEQGLLKNSVSFWTDHLRDLSELRLPEDLPASNIPDYAGQCESLAIPRELGDRLSELCKRERVTLFMILLALFQLLLHRHTGQKDIIICSPFAGRNRIELQGMIGYFNNIVPLRVSLDANLSFRELLSRTRREVSEVLEHQNVPFHMIASLANAASMASTNTRVSLTKAVFVLGTSAAPPLELAGVSVTPFDVPNGTANFDLCASLQNRGGTLTGNLEYKTSLFRPSTIQRMARDFEDLMQGAVSDLAPKKLSI